MKKIIKNIKDVGEKYLQKLVTDPIDEDWQKRIDSEWWGKSYSLPITDEKMIIPLKVRDKLLGFAGHEACMQFEPDDGENILNRGQFFLGYNANNQKKYKGKPCRCHENSSLLWDANSDNKDCHICTGYALSKDGCWRQHSWVVIENPCSYTVFETTEPRVAYYGFIMSHDECIEFYNQNT